MVQYAQNGCVEMLRLADAYKDQISIYVVIHVSREPGGVRRKYQLPQDRSVLGTNNVTKEYDSCFEVVTLSADVCSCGTRFLYNVKILVLRIQPYLWHILAGRTCYTCICTLAK